MRTFEIFRTRFIPSKNAGVASGFQPSGRQTLGLSTEKTGGIKPGTSSVLERPRYFKKLGSGVSSLAGIWVFIASLAAAVVDDGCLLYTSRCV